MTAEDGEKAILVTRAKIVDNQVEFEEYPPRVLFYNTGEWDAFLDGAKDGEFNF